MLMRTKIIAATVIGLTINDDDCENYRSNGSNNNGCCSNTVTTKKIMTMKTATWM